MTTSNFFTRLTITDTAFDQNTDVDLSSLSDVSSFSLVNEGSDTVEYSFDGKTVAGDLASQTYLIYNKKNISNIWFRTKNGISTSIRVEATSAGELEQFDNKSLTQNVSGTVNIGNIPHIVVDSLPSISGTVSVNNFPMTQNVDVTNIPHVVIDSLPSIDVNNFPSVQAVSATSLPLPTGAATASNQTTGNTSLASLDSKLPSLGSQSTSNSVSVTSALSNSLSTGQLAVTTSAQALSGSSTTFKNGILLSCLSSSPVSIFYGASGVTISTGAELTPGNSVVFPMQDLSLIYVIASSTGAIVSWSAFS